MSDPLKLGLAGLGTVGISVVKRLCAMENELAMKAGRTMRIEAITARTKNKDRGIDLSQYRWFDDPVAMAKSDHIDVFVELIGGDSGPRRGRCPCCDPVRQACCNCQQGPFGQTWQ